MTRDDTRVLLGYYIKRTWRGPPPIGKTWSAYPHRLYPSRKAAEAALKRGVDKLDDRFDHTITEAWMRV
jgi:hypothetical protein